MRKGRLWGVRVRNPVGVWVLGAGELCLLGLHWLNDVYEVSTNAFSFHSAALDCMVVLLGWVLRYGLSCSLSLYRSYLCGSRLLGTRVLTCSCSAELLHCQLPPNCYSIVVRYSSMSLQSLKVKYQRVRVGKPGPAIGPSSYVHIQY